MFQQLEERTMRRVVTIDIETLPAPDCSRLDDLSTGSKSAGDDYLKTALNGDFGQILCIGYMNEDCAGNVSKGVLGWDEKTEQFTVDESQILTEFWEMLRGFHPRTDCIVGHNIFDFDLKFICKRSVIHRVRPSVELSFARYRSQPIFDTMWEWERWSYGSRVSLDRLAKVLGLASSKAAGVDGSRVYDLFKAGEHRAIRDYCMRDVELTREIYRRLVFADLPMDSSRSRPFTTTGKVFSVA
jgi:DNA polymerase elongation subunit (family B)